MTISEPNPWGLVIDGQGHVLASEIHARWPDLDDLAIAAVGHIVWISGPTEHEHPETAIARIADAVAHLWPKWLAPLEVGCTVTVAGHRHDYTAQQMVLRA